MSKVLEDLTLYKMFDTKELSATTIGQCTYRLPLFSFPELSGSQGPSSLVTIPAIAWANSLNRTTVARAIAAAIARGRGYSQ